MAHVTFENVSKVFDDGVRAVDHLDLTIEDGELMVLVGPSGCGKTTALRMLAGLEDVSEGVIRIGERVVNDVPTRDRDIAMVFQNYSLYPHMTVRENIAFGLKMRRIPAATIAGKVNRAAQVLDLAALLGRLPKQLSGGQRQRVAMGRSIVREPRAFLMDEPLSNLDAQLRVEMRAQIAQLQRRLGVTMLYVTHDQVEAMTLGDRVAVMHGGILQQVADPHALYTHPCSLFVAGFIGAPPMNLVKSAFDVEGSDGVCRFGTHEIRVPGAHLASRPGLAAAAGSIVALGIRPEDITDAVPGDRSRPTITSTVRLIEYLGSDTLAHIAIDAPGVLNGAAETTTFIARCDPRTSLRRDETATFVVEIDRLHFFDLASGAAL